MNSEQDVINSTQSAFFWRRRKYVLALKITFFLVPIFLIFQQSRRQPEVVPLGDYQTVTTAYPQLGVHTRLNDEVDEWKIKRTLELVREMGSPTIVELFPWAYYEPVQGEFSWSHPDMVIAHAERQGLRVIARISLIPAWARPEETPLNFLPADRYDEFASFAAAFAERYAGRVDHIIVLNEPNLTFEWGGRITKPVDYVELLTKVYPAIKAANPDAVVLGGALAPTLEPEGSPNGLNDLIYLREMYELGAGELMDGLAVHTYGLTFPFSAEADPNVLNFRRVELLRDIMLGYGDDSPIYITESGWNDHPRWTHGVRPAQRIDYTREAIDYAKKNWPYVETISFWMFRTPALTRSYLDYYTFVTPEFVEKPIYTAVRDFATQSDGN